MTVWNPPTVAVERFIRDVLLTAADSPYRSVFGVPVELAAEQRALVALLRKLGARFELAGIDGRLLLTIFAGPATGRATRRMLKTRSAVSFQPSAVGRKF